MAAYDSLQVGDTITVSGLSARYEINGTYSIFNKNVQTNFTNITYYTLSALIDGFEVRGRITVVDNGSNAFETWPNSRFDYLEFYQWSGSYDNDYLEYYAETTALSSFKWFYTTYQVGVEEINLPNWQINWGGGTWGPGGSGSSQPTFGLPADVVALITSRFGTVANFLRLRNQGQV